MYALFLAVIMTVQAAKVFPYARKWEFTTIPSGLAGITEGYTGKADIYVSQISNATGP